MKREMGMKKAATMASSRRVSGRRSGLASMRGSMWYLLYSAYRMNCGRRGVSELEREGRGEGD